MFPDVSGRPLFRHIPALCLFSMPAHFIHFADFDLALHRRILARAVAIKKR